MQRKKEYKSICYKKKSYKNHNWRRRMQNTLSQKVKETYAYDRNNMANAFVHMF